MKTVNEKEFFTLQKTEEAAKSKFVAETVSEIINNVRQNGDSALFEYAKKFGKPLFVSGMDDPLVGTLIKARVCGKFH